MKFFRRVFRSFQNDPVAPAQKISRWDFLSRYEIGVILDVGAHFGDFSRELLEVFPFAHVVCFEPVPESAERLRKTTPFEVVESAISDSNGTATFFQSSFVQSSSLVEMMNAHKTLWPHSADHQSFPVTVSRLDDWWQSRRAGLKGGVLIKIDAQGAERGIIHGAQGLLNLAAVVVCEICFVELYRGQALASEIIQDLHSFGLQLIGVIDVHTESNGRQVFANAVFARMPGLHDV